MAVSTEAVLAVIAAEAGIDQTALSPEATFEQLDIGSLDLASALFTLEDQFGIVIDPDCLSPTSTISDFIALVSSLSPQ